MRNKIFNIAGATMLQPRAKPHKWFSVRNSDDATKPVEMLIYDHIGKDWFSNDGVGAKDFAEALKAIPADREIKVLINSPGGNVWDGLAIYHQLQARRDKVTTRVDGVAASIASIIAMAGKETQVPKNALMMIHDPTGIEMGTAEDMRKMADALDKHKDVLAGIYQAKSGLPMTQIARMMSDETWMTGSEAMGHKLCDTLLDEVSISAVSTFDFSRFRRVPKALTNKEKPASLPASLPQDTMNKKDILAMLKKHGVKIADDATDEQIMAALETLREPAPPAPIAPPAAQADPAVAALNTTVANITAQLDKERRGRIEAAIQAAITEDKIPANQKDNWVKRAMADEAVLNDLNALTPKPPGAAPITAIVSTVNDSVEDTFKAYGRFLEPMKAWQRGNTVKPQELASASTARGAFWNTVRSRILPIMNVGVNTVDATLKRDVILQEIIVDFVRRLLPLRLFATNFGNVPLEGTNKVQVPFYDLDATGSTSWVAATGYAATDTVTDNREITIGSLAADGDRLYQGLSFTSEEIARQPFLNILQLAKLKAEKLASDIVTDVLGIVTAANFGAAAKIEPAAAFDSDDVIDLKLACKTWPEMGRGLILDSAYDANLLKDVSFKHALNAASDSAIKEGRLFPRVIGFDYTEINTLPANGENLVGFAVFRSAILFAQAPVPPVQEVRNAGTQYQIVTDPITGISFEYRQFGDNTLDTGKHFIEASYGFAKGNANALKRITSV